MHCLLQPSNLQPQVCQQRGQFIAGITLVALCPDSFYYDVNVAAAPTKSIRIYDAKFASAVAAISGSTPSTTRGSMATHQCFHEGKDEPPAAASSPDKRPVVADIMCNVEGNPSLQIASPALTSPALTSPSEGQFDLCRPPSCTYKPNLLFCTGKFPASGSPQKFTGTK